MWVNKLLNSPGQPDTSSRVETAGTEVVEASQSEELDSERSNDGMSDNELDEGKGAKPGMDSGLMFNLNQMSLQLLGVREVSIHSLTRTRAQGDLLDHAWVELS